jgi:hypothetical protein
MVQYEIEMRSKFGAFKSICFLVKTFIKVFNKIWHKFGYFSSTIVNKMKPSGICYALKMSLFSASTLPANHFQQILNENVQTLKQN